jgi:hypothetical protein
VLQITWDLDVIPCCFDSNASIVLGNLRHQSLEEVFQGSTYRDFIAAHMVQSLDPYPACRAFRSNPQLFADRCRGRGMVL